MELTPNVNLNIENKKEQNEFLNTTLWKTINNGIDIGLRCLLPDLIENEIIELKDNLINFGLKDGIKKTIDSAIETGKQTVGIVTGNFENINQVQGVIKNGGIVDKLSDILDNVINKAERNGKINNFTSNILKNGKTSILSSVEKNIENTLNNQINGAKLVEKYINNWKEYYNKKDFNGMDKEYSKLQKQLKELIPIENTLKNARYIENIHKLVKNKGKNFDLSDEEIELAKKFSI